MFVPRNTVSKIFIIGNRSSPIADRQIAVGEAKVNRRKREASVCLTALPFLLTGRIGPSHRMMAKTTAYDVLPVVRRYLDCQNGGIR